MRRLAGGNVSGQTGSSPGRVAVISGSIGAGHDGAARALVRELAAAGYRTSCHDFLELIGPRAGRGLRALYAAQLRIAPRSWGWMLGDLSRNPRHSAGPVAVLARMATRRTHEALGPDVTAVVSTYPLASQALGWLRRRGELAAPVVTYLTDPSVHPLWIAAGVDRHLALHEVAAGQARALGAAHVEVVRPAVDPAFRTAEPRQLPVDGPVALVVAGSWGV